jgi:hypothetical protein
VKWQPGIALPISWGRLFWQISSRRGFVFCSMGIGSIAIGADGASVGRRISADFRRPGAVFAARERAWIPVLAQCACNETGAKLLIEDSRK